MRRGPARSPPLLSGARCGLALAAPAAASSSQHNLAGNVAPASVAQVAKAPNALAGYFLLQGSTDTSYDSDGGKVTGTRLSTGEYHG
jgi:hypothetical protein